MRVWDGHDESLGGIQFRIWECVRVLLDFGRPTLRTWEGHDAKLGELQPEFGRIKTESLGVYQSLVGLHWRHTI